MFINDSEDLRDAVLRALKTLAIKPRIKREPNSRRRQNDVTKGNSIIFRIPLEQLPSTEVCLDCGAYVSVPCIVVQLCDRILVDVNTEGIFRKNGSQARQHDIKVMLEKGGRITNSHHVIDVAVLLKEFFRCLPTPLIPYNIHDDLLKCLSLTDKCLEAMLLLTLVMPPSHLNVLAYVMQVLNQITAQSAQNKMDAHNLSVVMAPNIMPSTSRNTYMCANSLARSENFRRIVEDLIINASLVGSIPECVQLHPISSAVNTPNEDYVPSNRRKRRSASLTRMFSGLKRMVAKTNAPEEANPGCQTPPDQCAPPLPTVAVISPGGKKRKFPQDSQPALGFSAKKRCDESDALYNAPAVPAKRKFFSHSASNLKKSTTSLKEKARKSFSGTGLKISRLKLRKSKSKEKGLDTTDEHELNVRLESEPETCSSKTPDEFVCVPKREYEEMEQRVSRIETRISQEFGNQCAEETSCGDDDARMESDDIRRESKRRRPSIENVQNEYAKTLDKVSQLNSTCDNLAERLGRDLRIRVTRSPSARKIGSIRRRSKERNARPVTRHRSLNIHDKTPSYRVERNRSICRGKPLQTEVISLKPGTISGNSTPSSSQPTERITRQTAPRRAQSCLVPKRTQIPVKHQPGWQCAQSFLNRAVPHMLQETRRDSIAKLKAQNAGMVMAKAKLFDNYADENERGKSESGDTSVKFKTRMSAGGNMNISNQKRSSVTSVSNSTQHLFRTSMPNQSANTERIENSNINNEINRSTHARQPNTNGRKSLSEVVGNKENLLSQTLENIIYDTCKVRTPDMPIIKKPLTSARSISFRQPTEMCRTPVPLTPRRSPRLVELKSRPLIS